MTIRYYKIDRLAIVAACAVLAASSVAYAEVRIRTVKGTATTEKFACEAAIRRAKADLAESEIVSIGPCRCAKVRDYRYECTVAFTYKRQD